MSDNEDRKALGERLKRARIESGSRSTPARDVSKAWVGRQLGVTGVAVGLWESGANEPSRATLEALARLYGVELLWLTFGRGPMYDDAPENVRTNVMPPDMFTRLETGDDLRTALGEPPAQKKKRGNGGKEAG